MDLAELFTPWCDGQTGAETNTRWTDDYLKIFITFSTDIELFHNDFAYPDPYVYSNDLCFNFLQGDTF